MKIKKKIFRGIFELLNELIKMSYDATIFDYKQLDDLCKRYLDADYKIYDGEIIIIEIYSKQLLMVDIELINHDIDGGYIIEDIKTFANRYL